MSAHLLQLNAIIEEFTDILSPVFGKTAHKETSGIIADYLDVAPSKIRFGTDAITIAPGQKTELADRINRRAQHEPPQYICGTAWFMGEKFHVGQGVLIPRSDTEILVEEAIRIARGEVTEDPNYNFLEFCTGSGCIALSFIKEMLIAGIGIQGTATDVSPAAMSFAAMNAELSGLSSHIKLVRHDIMSNPQILQTPISQFRMILANPPYIRTDIIAGLEPEVSRYEPHLALDGGNDGLKFYRRIIECADMILAQNGWLIMEIGHDQEKEVMDLIEGSGMFEDIMIRKDYNGNPRVASGKKRYGR